MVVLARGFRRVNGHGAFFGLIGGMTVVTIFASHRQTKDVSFLWHNPIGMIAVVIVGILVSLATGGQQEEGR